MNILSPVNTKIDNFLNTMNPNERIFSNRTIKIGIPSVLGGIAFGIITYNNYDLLSNATKGLLARTIGENSSIPATIIRTFTIIWTKFNTFIQAWLRPIIKLIVNFFSKTYYDLQIAFIQLCMQIFGKTKLLNLIDSRIVSKAHTLYNDPKFNIFGPIVTLVSTATYGLGLFIMLYGALLVCHEASLFIRKVCSSNNKFLKLKFLIGAFCNTRSGVTGKLLKLPNEILDEIIISRPWKALTTLSNQTSFSNIHLKDMLYLAGYPWDMFYDIKVETNTNLLGDRITTTSYTFKYPSLWIGVDDVEPLWRVLYYLGEFPELYKGNNKLPDEILDTILSLKDPRLVLKVLCTNTHLWQGADKLEPDILLQFLTHPQFDLIHKKMTDWLSLKGSYKLQKNEIHQIFNLGNSFDWTKFIFQKITNIYEAEQMERSKTGFQGPFLNIKKLFNDCDMDKWNMLPCRSGNISQDDWNELNLVILPTILQKIYPTDYDTKIPSLQRLCGKCLGSKDAGTPVGVQSIIHQIASVFDYLAGITVELESIKTDYAKDQSLREIKAIIEILAIDEKICPDGAIVALNLAENQIKMFHASQYMGNILANLFKLNSIQAVLLNQNYGENAEGFLYYVIKFNECLGLGRPISTMLHERFAQKQPLGQAMNKLITAFTEDNLIEYAANLNIFKMRFEGEAKSKLQEIVPVIQQLMDEVYGIEGMALNEKKQLIDKIQALGIKLEEIEIRQIYDKPNNDLSDHLMRHLDNKRVRIEHDFYKQKATEVFIKSGFLQTKLST